MEMRNILCISAIIHLVIHEVVGSKPNKFCNETLIMHLDIQSGEVRKISIFFNTTEIGSSENDSNGNWRRLLVPEYNEYNDRLEIGLLGGLTTTLHNVSSFDDGLYKTVITYEIGSYTVIDWQLTFSILMDHRKAYKIILLHKETTPPKDSERTGLKNREITYEYPCRQTTVECFIMDETFRCRQEIPKSIGTVKNEKVRNAYLYPLLGVIAFIVISAVIAIVCVCCVRKYKKKQKRKRLAEIQRERLTEQYYIDQDKFGSIRQVPNPEYTVSVNPPTTF